MSFESSPLSPLQNRVFRNSEDLERTIVGFRDDGPKIQLCIELRRKEVQKRRNSKVHKELVLEVSVMYLKNLPLKELANSTRSSPFVKISMVPGTIIHSTELKMDKQNHEKVDLDFVEVFAFPLTSVEALSGKMLEVLVCDKKMTRNATIFGETQIDLDDVKLGMPICKWFNLTAEKEEKKD